MGDCFLMVSEKDFQAITPAPDFRRDRVAGVKKLMGFLDSGFRRKDS